MIDANQVLEQEHEEQITIWVQAYVKFQEFSYQELENKTQQLAAYTNAYFYNKELNYNIDFKGIKFVNDNENSINFLFERDSNKELIEKISYKAKDVIDLQPFFLSEKLINAIHHEKANDYFKSGINALFVNKAHFEDNEKILSRPEIPVLSETSKYLIYEIDSETFWGKVEVFTEKMKEEDYYSVWVGKPIVTAGAYYNKLGSKYLCRGKKEKVLVHSNYTPFDKVEFDYNKTALKSAKSKNKTLDLMVNKSVNYFDIKFRAKNDFGWSKWKETTFTVLDNCDALLKSDITFKVYPNPTSDKLSIEADDEALESFTVDFYNQVGEFVRTIHLLKDEAIDVTSFEPGNYHLKVFTAGGIAEHQVVIN